MCLSVCLTVCLTVCVCLFADDDPRLETELVDEVARETVTAHSALLRGGLALNQQPTVSQALDGVIPFRWVGKPSVNQPGFLYQTLDTEHWTLDSLGHVRRGYVCC